MDERCQRRESTDAEIPLPNSHPMTPDTVKRIHKWALILWACPGLPLSVAAVLTGNVLLVLVINMVMSIYTILMEHFLGWRQEKDKQKGEG